MPVATTLLYPLLLASLCLGAGLLVDRLAGGWLHGALLAPVGAAALIAVSQLLTIAPLTAPATPWALLATALGGVLASPRRAAALPASIARDPLRAAAALAVYALALAPVLLAGRQTFSYAGLSDPAVHLVGADYLLAHGQSYGGLDLRNSYGLVIQRYYGSGYPSGGDTLFGATARLLGLGLLWAYQPFNCAMLAIGTGPAWLIARRLGLRRAGAALAAAVTMLPALVYAYELQGSIKEIVTLPLLLAAGCLVSRPQRWALRGPRGALPLALLLAGGVSVLGAAFGAWAVASIAVLAGVLALSRLRPPRLGAGIASGAAVALLAALPTWRHIGGAVRVAGSIATTGNPGNLHSPLRPRQLLGVWLDGSYKLVPAGAAGVLDDILGALILAAAVAGVAACARRGARGLGVWLAMMLATWLAISNTVATWAEAKTLVLTSPMVIALAWGGVATLRRVRPRALAFASAGAASLVIAGGAIASDALQYSAVNIAPTARYEELGRIDRAFAGQGPALFTDFDEYSLYVLRDLDIGSPNFAFPAPALGAVAGGYGQPFSLGRIPPRSFGGYPLIVTRRDPAAERPPAAYRLAWAGRYYLVWERAAGSPTALRHFELASVPATSRCATLERAAAAAGPGGRVAAALAPRVVPVALRRSRRPKSWRGDARGRITMKRPGTLTARFTVPFSGRWELSLRGQLMPAIAVTVDGRQAGTVAGELSGNSLISSPAPPFALFLRAGAHSLGISRPAPGLGPGDRGSAVLTGAQLSPAAQPAGGVLVALPARAWRRLCRRPLQWVEALPGPGGLSVGHASARRRTARRSAAPAQ